MAGCIVWSICPDKMSLTARPEPTQAIWTGSACCQPVTQRACESGRQKNKLTLCPAAHLGSNGKKKKISICVCAVLQVWALVGCVREGRLQTKSCCLLCDAGGHICTDKSALLNIRVGKSDRNWGCARLVNWLIKSLPSLVGTRDTS